MSALASRVGGTSFATSLSTTMNANAPNTASYHLLRMLQRNSLDAAFTPEGAEYVEHFCGLDY